MTFKALYRTLLIVLFSICLLSMSGSNRTPLQNGDTFPDLQLQDTSGVLVHFSEATSNKYVLVEFWASWCGKCSRIRPEMNKLVRDLNAEGINQKQKLEFVTISLDEEREKWLSAIQGFEENALHLRAGQGWKSEAIQKTGVSYLPYVYVLKPDGRIMTQGLLGSSLRSKLEAELKN